MVGRLLWEQERECSIHSTPTKFEKQMFYSSLAQVVEYVTVNHGVGGSSPPRGASFKTA